MVEILSTPWTTDINTYIQEPMCVRNVWINYLVKNGHTACADVVFVSYSLRRICLVMPNPLDALTFHRLFVWGNWRKSTGCKVGHCTLNINYSNYYSLFFEYNFSSLQSSRKIQTRKMKWAHINVFSSWANIVCIFRLEIFVFFIWSSP